MTLFLTKEQALHRQEGDIHRYCLDYPGGEPALREAVADITTADALDGGKQYSIHVIAQHIPTGARIAALVTAAAAGAPATGPAGSFDEPLMEEHIEQA